MINIFKYLFNWEYRYLYNKIRSVDKTIVDLEFKRFKTREVREEIRELYDNTNSRLAALKEQIKQEALTPSLEAGDAARLNDQQVLLERDIERYKKQIDGLDIEVNGAAPTNDYPEGVQGLNQQLDSLQELKLMIRDYVKQL